MCLRVWEISMSKTRSQWHLYAVWKVSACCVRVYVHLCVGMHLTLYFIGLQVEVLQGGGDCGNGCKFVIRKVQFHQAGEVEDLWANAAALQTTVT